MANTIDQAFIKQFETEVHMAYQRMGSKLRNTVRTTNVAGSVARFQVIGKGVATTKSRNGNVTPMELAHTNVEATMADFYAPEYIDKLDELKININERQAVAQSAAAALGRKTDEILITAMDAGASGTQIHDTGSALEKADLLSLFETMGTADVPEDGQRYLAMSPKGFADLYAINEFASSDFAYHTSAIGLGINADVQTEVNYVAEKVSHLATSMMSMGAIVIDATGVYEVLDNN